MYMIRSHRACSHVARIAAMIAAGTIASAVCAQNSPDPQTGALLIVTTTEDAGQGLNRSTLALPSGDRQSSVLLLERLAPRQIRVGQAMRYNIRATNLTNNSLGHVVVAEILGHGVQIESSQPPVRQPDNAPGQSQQEQQQQRALSQQQSQQATVPQAGVSQQGQQTTGSQAGAQHQQPPSGGIVQWELGALAPGETRTISVVAVVNQVGNLTTCLTASYFPALCAMTEVVQPNLELTAGLAVDTTGPISICEAPTVRYRV